MPRYLYLDDVRFAVLDLSEPPGPARSRRPLELPAEMGHTTDPAGELQRHEVAGLILGLNRGWAGRSHFRLLDEAKRRGISAFFYWNNEEVIERVDGPRRGRHLRVAALARLYSIYRRRPLGSSERGEGFPRPPSSAAVPRDLNVPASGALPGRGVYVRLDYWARFESGGSYGHTCHVARELGRRTEEGVLALVPHPYAMLDEFGIRQVQLTNPEAQASETDIILANRHYYPILKTALGILRPAYVYERVVLGSFVLARLCRELGIPYIAEYNGSEISMGRVFGSTRYAYERPLLRIEDFVFRQATLIVVVSRHIKTDLVNRGIDPARILVNPNGGDPDMYAPAAPSKREEIRRSLGFGPEDRVVGFCGTFGGWHGIDVLAAAIPKVCAAEPRTRFLLIGDGNEKHMVDAAVARHGLSSRVISVGRTTQAEGARYQAACDLLVSPHSRNMADRPFFGSPTKLFEYMGCGVGIVASDLEQIGEVLSPALRPDEVGSKPVSTERAVLCKPGDTEEFVQGVLALVRNEAVARALGKNARQALLDHFTWSAHVERIWQALGGEARPVPGISYAGAGRNESSPSPGVEPISSKADGLLDGVVAGRGGKRTRVLAFAIVNPMILAPLEGGDAEIVIVEPWGRHWNRFIDAHAGNARSLAGTLDSIPKDSGPFDLFVTERGFDFGDSPDALFDAARQLLSGGGELRARVRLSSSLSFWWDGVIMAGLAAKQLGDHSPDEISGRDEELMSPHLVAFGATEIRALAGAYGNATLRRHDLGPRAGFRRVLYAAGLERLLGFRGDLTVRFPETRSRE